MNTMSASSAAPAGLMPLSLIAEHKTAQSTSSSVQSLQRSGSDKCVTPGTIPKPTANGMEGSGPLPLVSQIHPSASAELIPQQNTNTTSNSDIGVQLTTSHVYQPSHQNLLKNPDVLPTTQDGSGASSFAGSGAVPATNTADRRHTEEITHHQVSSTSVSTTVETPSRPAVPSQLLQLHTPPTGTQFASPPVSTSPDSASVGAVGCSSTSHISASPLSPQPEPALTTLEESATRVLETMTVNQVSTLENNPLKQVPEQPKVDEPQLQPSSQLPVLTEQSQNASVATSVNTSPKSSQQIPASNTSTFTNPVTPSSPQSPNSTAPVSLTGTAEVTPQLPPTESNSNVLKVATLPRQTSKRAVKVASSSATTVEPSKKSGGGETMREKESVAAGDKPRRKRLPTQPYQSPIPELNIMAKFKKMKELNEKDKEVKNTAVTSTDKLIVFYRNEFLAVRNSDGGFYVCQAMQNVYKSSTRIRIRWLSQQPDASSDLYIPDFYDHTEFDCILTNLNLERVDKNKFRLPQAENRRTESILQRALDVERGVAPPPADDTLTETHPDGLDLSLYRNEEQLKKNKKSKKKINKQKQPRSGDVNRSTAGTDRRKIGSGGGSTISASAVAKAKKAAAIKRTAAVKKVVQAAAAKKQATAPPVSVGLNKKQGTVNASTRNSLTSLSNKKGTKVHSSVAVNKRKAGTPLPTVVVPEKRTRREISSSQPTQSQGSNNSNVTQGKTRGTAGGTDSTSNKTLNSNKSGTGVTSNGSNTTAGGTRRTLRNSK